MVNTMMAAATATPPANGVRTADIAVTTWYAASTGTPKRLNMAGNPPAGQKKRLTAGDGRDQGSWRGAWLWMCSLSHETQEEYEASGNLVHAAHHTKALGQDQAAAGTAVGALGRGRPAASGSRWRRYAADQDFSRRPAARRVSGGAVAIRAMRAPSAATAATRPISTAASTAVLTNVRALGPVGRCPRCRRTAAAASAPSRIPGTAAASALTSPHTGQSPPGYASAGPGGAAGPGQ